MNFLAAILQHADLYMLIFGRVSGFFLTVVPFSGRNVPVQIKIGLAAFTAFLILTVLISEEIAVAGNLLGFLLQFLGELMVGLLIGFLTQIVFGALQLAGQIMDMQIGFGIVSVVDPQYGIQVPVLGSFKYFLAVLFFLTINGHHLFLKGLKHSYKLVPISNLHFTGPLYSFIFQLASGMFLIALQIALPVVAALFVTDLALGIIARTVPQMNVFIVGLPLKIGVGFILLIIILPAYFWIFKKVFQQLFQDLESLLLILGG